jgi:hypothetical protein
VLVVGSGVASAATNGAPVASWTGLLESGVDRCAAVVHPLPPRWVERTREQIASGDRHELLLAAESVAQRLGAPDGGEYRRWLRETVGALRAERPDVLEALKTLRVPIATTNYDGLLEEVTGWEPVTWRDGTRVERVLRGDDLGVLHLHGYWQDPASVVLGIRSHEDVLGSAHAQAVQRALSLLNSLVFVGFGAGLSDPNLGAFLRWTRTVFAGSEYRHFRLARADQVAVFQGEHQAEERVFVLSYGDRHQDLAPFLRGLRPGRPASELGTGAEAMSLTDLERRVLRTLFARYPAHDSINLRSVGKVDHTADPSSPHLWDLHKEPGLLEALERLNDLMLIKYEVESDGFARAIILPDGISQLRANPSTPVA